MALAAEANRGNKQLVRAHRGTTEVGAVESAPRNVRATICPPVSSTVEGDGREHHVVRKRSAGGKADNRVPDAPVEGNASYVGRDRAPAGGARLVIVRA